MRRAIFVVGFTAFTLCNPLVAAQIEDLAWLQGHWQAQQGAGWVEEHWLAPRDGIMLGVNRGGNGKGQVSFEFLRIQDSGDGNLTYWAAPGGNTAVPFKLEQTSSSDVSFVNPGHDYPQKIRYERVGDTLTATISAVDGTNAMDFVWQLADSAE